MAALSNQWSTCHMASWWSGSGTGCNGAALKVVRGQCLAAEAAHCLVTPGGGVVWASARAEPPTHPTSSVEQQSRTDQQKFTTTGVGTQDLETRVQRYNQLSYQPVLTVMCNKGFTCLMQYEKKVKNV